MSKGLLWTRNLKCLRVYRRQCRIFTDAKADAFDYIERLHNLRITRRAAEQNRKLSAFSEPSTEVG